MSDSESTPQAYKPKIRRDFGISPLWILPIVTIALAAWLVVNAINDAGQRIQIYFSDAQGLIAGRTTIRYQGLEVGMVRDISLSPNLDNIYVDADIYPQATKLLGKDTRFWLVKPTASISGISGLDALVSGNYIAIQPGDSLREEDEELTKKYIALDNRPVDVQAEQGLNITLQAQDLGSISIGSQIVYKKIPIGEVYSYKLDDNSKTVLIKAYVKNEYANIITDKSRFWNVSGVGAQIGFDGVEVQFESLRALLTGAIAVDSPDGGEPVDENTLFRLYPDLKTAGRGIPIKIILPNESRISAGGAPIMYRGLEIGQITDLSLSNGRESIVASAAIQPAFSDTLTSGTRFMLEEAKLTLGEVNNLSNLVTGNFLTLIPGNGEEARNFKALRKDELLREKSHSVSIELVADESYGIDIGTEILYKGISVGSVTDRLLIDDKVLFSLLIDNKYSHLIKSENRFFISGSASASLSESGIDINIPPVKQLLAGSISFTSRGKQKARERYALYANQSLAELAEYNRSGTYSITLLADKLPSLTKGSPLLYRNLPVGKVSGYSLFKSGVKVSVKVENRYRYLINEHTVFWNHSGVEVDASLQGVKIKAAPLTSLVKGSLAFDTIHGVENRKGKFWRLYESAEQARRYGKTITLTTDKTTPLAPGAEIRYKGLPVGEITALKPNFDTQITEITGRVFPEYVEQIAIQGSYFWLPSAKVGLQGVQNIDSLLKSYINVEPGKGETSLHFVLNHQPKQEKGIHFNLQSERRNSVEVGTPLLYRDIEVGRVVAVELGSFADRVVTHIEVLPKYAYLIRVNTIFWNVSGVDVSLGLSGAEIKAGTVDSLLRGGIAFAIPEGNQLQPQAKEGRSFILHQRPKSEWTKWRTPIPKP